jgi:uncharacterized protein YrrD
MLAMAWHDRAEWAVLPKGIGAAWYNRASCTGCHVTSISRNAVMIAVGEREVITRDCAASRPCITVTIVLELCGNWLYSASVP